MTLSLTETLPHNNPELQLCLQDLVHPTETAENLLISLSIEQLAIIERTLSKIKEKKTIVIQPEQESSIENENKSTTVQNKTISTTPSTPLINNDTTNNTTTTTTTTNTTLIAAKPPSSTNNISLSQEPTTEVKEGVEWVNFVYSHHRTLRKYSIRTDLDKVDVNLLDEKFKQENCVYPRANLPQETYRGNRWNYETECNVLGWKLAYLNPEEIAGKRGLIQRAVDSYRNRYPSMRSRRVARQEKLLKGTLRKRKQREDDNTKKPATMPTDTTKLPKTILIEDLATSTKCRIRINIESVVLDAIDLAFRKNNCVFPRSINITPDTPSVSQRRIDEAKCNEIGWKLAWLNPRQLANKKNLLQRVLDIFRNQYAPDLKPRKYASRIPPPPPLPLTEETLAAQSETRDRRKSTDSCYSGTTVTLDFHDYCFSPPPEEMMEIDEPSLFINTPISNSNDDSPSPQSLLTLIDAYQQAGLFINQQQQQQQPGDLKPSNELFLSQPPLDLCTGTTSNTTTDPALTVLTTPYI